MTTLLPGANSRNALLLTELQRLGFGVPAGGSTAGQAAVGLADLGLDELQISDDARGKLSWARAQFEVNYQTLRSINGANDQETAEVGFSLQASYEFLALASGRRTPEAQPATPASSMPAARTNPATATASPTPPTTDPLADLQDYFSPARTAERILDVALSFFGLSEAFKKGGNTEDARKQYAEFIGGAIDEGFRQARQVLGEVPEFVDTGVNDTHRRVFAGLDAFVTDGIPAAKQGPEGVLEKIARYRGEAARWNQVIVDRATAYDADGAASSTNDTGSRISQKV